MATRESRVFTCDLAGVTRKSGRDRWTYILAEVRNVRWAEGLSMEKVARFLGNSIIVCQEYYTGYVASLPDMAGLR